MLKSLQILILGIAMSTPLAFGQLGSLGDFDGVLQAKFALVISEMDAADPDADAETFTLTSGALIREYDLPGTARVYWVFDFDGPHIQGGLVVADSETGEIHALIAEATQVSLNDFVDEGGAETGAQAWLTANYAIHFDIDGLQLSTQALMKFQFVQANHFSLLRMSSIAGPVGEGAFDDQTYLSITGGSISASGIIANPE